jgi:hypothetical protein
MGTAVFVVACDVQRRAGVGCSQYHADGHNSTAVGEHSRRNLWSDWGTSLLAFGSTSCCFGEHLGLRYRDARVVLLATLWSLQLLRPWQDDLARLAASPAPWPQPSLAPRSLGTPLLAWRPSLCSSPGAPPALSLPSRWLPSPWGPQQIQSVVTTLEQVLAEAEGLHLLAVLLRPPCGFIAEVVGPKARPPPPCRFVSWRS